MRYSQLLTEYIANSGLSLREIAKKATDRGVKVDSSYISKLKNGNVNPPSEELSMVLAELTEGDPIKLILAGYMDKAPEPVKELLNKVVDHENFYRTLLDYVDVNVVVEGDDDTSLELKKSKDVINSPEFFKKLDPETRQLFLQGALQGLYENDPNAYSKLQSQVRDQSAKYSTGEDWTDEELEEIEKYKDFLRSKRDRKGGKD